MITNATQKELELALKRVNKTYKNNIKFKRLDQKTKNRINFTLTVHSSKGLGGRIGHTGRKICACCWHGYRDFLKELFEINPNIKVISCHANYDGKDGFYQNFPDTGYKNIGSMMQPLNMMDACECAYH